MNTSRRVLLSLVILVVLIFGLYFFTDWFSKTTGYISGDNQKTELAQCLSEKGVVLYVSATCPDCDKQIKIFGEAAQYLNLKECKSIEECAEVSALPAWRIDSKYYYGTQEINTLSEISGC